MLTAGRRIGPYEILGKLGEGGMGEVYRARDTSLNRDVAIKVLPESLAADPERVARFRREAQSLAALNHPNIAQVYGVIDLPAEAGNYPGVLGGAGAAAGNYPEGAKGATGLVMEFVDGADLSWTIAKGAMPIDDALAIARQIADALEAAHEQGIVHRDLKPANIKVKADGSVKVLDFGLAKAMGDDSGMADLANSPTLTAPRGMTQMGVILGTAAYMAPEQARGKAVDRRADIWAFGVVLYEMLTGRALFAGDNLSDVLAAVLKTDPEWTALPADVPAPVRRLLRRCLERDPRARLSSIADARLELNEREAEPPARVGQLPVRSSGIPAWAAMLAGAAIAAAAGAAWWWTRPAPVNAVIRSSIIPPSGQALYPDSSMVAISPDGRTIAFVVGRPTAPDSQLWVRSLDSVTATRLEDAEGGRHPFWSPDGKRIGFFTTTKLKTIAATGGRSETIGDAPSARGGTWSPTNMIVFAPTATGPLMKVPATGGTPAPATTLDAARKEFSHRFPAFLPDGRHFIYAALPAHDGQSDIFVGSLDGGAVKRIGSMETAPTFAAPNWLLFTRQGVLHAQRFDPSQLTLSGDPLPLGDEPSRLLDTASSFTAGRSISAGSNGALAYFSAPSNQTQAVWFDAAGRNLGPLNLPAGHYDWVAIAPDGAHAVLVRSITASESSLWLADLTTGGAAPLTTVHGRSDGPVWSPDSSRVVFNTDREGRDTLYIKTVGDPAPEQPFYRSDVLFQGVNSWTPDGKWIVTTEFHADTAQDIYLLPAVDPKKSTPLVRGLENNTGGPVSPDGRWLLYVSSETGRREIYVQSFPTPGRRVQITQAGARRGWWTPDGRLIVFVADDGTLFQVDFAGGDTPRGGTPRRLGALPQNALFVEASPDRQRFLAIVPTASGDGSITLIQNWVKAIQ